MDRAGGESADRGTPFVREARPGDGVRVRELAAQLGYPSSEAAFSPRWEHALQEGDPAVFVAARADDPGRVDGWIGVRASDSFYSHDCAEITGLVVDETARGQGLGSALIDRASAWASARGYDTLRLRANAIRTGALEFYRARGFTEKKRQVVFERSCEPAATASRDASPPWRARSLGDGFFVRPLEQDDAGALYDLLERERPRLSLRLAFIARVLSPQDAERFILECSRRTRHGEGCYWGIFSRASGAGAGPGRAHDAAAPDSAHDALVGMTSISTIDRSIDCGELAYYIAQAHEGRGIVGRAVDLALDHLFVDLGLQKALVCCQPDNLRSSAVALRRGFVREGVIRNGFRLKGSLVDVDCYGLLRSEYYALQCGRKS